MLHREKADQAQVLLRETGLDCWLTFVRESGIHPDPGVELVVGVNVTWPSAFLFSASGDRIAIVGRFDTANIKNTGVFTEVIGYDEGIRADLLAVLQRLDPKSIGLNYSVDDVTADGLTYGMWLQLQDLLRNTPFASKLTTAAPLLAKLRGRKSPNEVERIRKAIASTLAIVERFGEQIQPGKSELELAEFVHEEFRRANLPSAWEWESCPIVNSGPNSEPGHSRPQADIRVEPGHLVHIDLGVRQEDYCSDLQRMWYVRRPGESRPPVTVQRAFDTVLAAIDAAMHILRPGVRGVEVDTAARQVVMSAGYEEFKHALGHGLGRAVHDGGTLLGPLWPKYGKTPEGAIEAGNVFTVELGLMTEAGYVGLEEDVLVTESGCEYLSTPQRELWLI